MPRSGSISRRDLIAAGAAGVLLPSLAAATPRQDRKRTLRFAHLTDTHIQPERRAGEGFAAALNHAQSQADKPDLIFTGGDIIMDAFATDKARAKVQWDLFTRVCKDSLSLPIEHTVGNHDVWGWANPDAHSGDADYGKKWACDLLGLEKPYRAFDRAGWKFVVLDGTHVNGKDYIAKLDDEQFEWLTGVLEATPKSTPVIVVGHMPIIGAGAYFDGDNEKSGNWVVPGKWMHIDARKIKDLFRKHPNVKLSISGHIHLVDQVVYNDVTYFCNGAVCAGWWGGPYQECVNGYALVNLYDDGTFENRYVTFPWPPQG